MKKKKGRFVLPLFILILMGAIGYLAYQYLGQKDQIALLADDITTYQQRENDNQRYAYVALKDISAGEELVEDENVEIQQIYAGVPDTLLWMPSDESGHTARVDVPVESPIFFSMVTNESPENDIRGYEIATVNLMATQDNYDCVDVRIVFPDGSDYVVLAKKMISNLSLTNCIFTVDATEDEIQRMDSAILDAYLNGARMYTVTYPETNLQEASQMTYPLRDISRDLCLADNNPNVLRETLNKAKAELNRQARLDLEARLSFIDEETLEVIAENWELVDELEAAKRAEILDAAEAAAEAQQQ